MEKSFYYRSSLEKRTDERKKKKGEINLVTKARKREIGNDMIKRFAIKRISLKSLRKTVYQSLRIILDYFLINNVSNFLATSRFLLTLKCRERREKVLKNLCHRKMDGR